MKTKNVLIVFAILMISVFFTNCKDAVTDSDRNPKPKSVTVKYARVLPIPYPDGVGDPALLWLFDPYQGGTSPMTGIAENTFSVGGVAIKTETAIHMYIDDIKEWNGSTAQVCKSIYIDGQELVVGSTIYGQVTFIYGNDGKVRVTGS